MGMRKPLRRLDPRAFAAPEARPNLLVTRDTRSFVQQRAHETHAALLNAAADVFAKRGFDDTQTPDIARAAGVSVGTFYRYFADKRQAFIEMIERRMQAMFERVMANLTVDAFGATRTAEDRLAAVNKVIDVLFHNTSENPGLQRVFLAMSMRDPDVARIRRDLDERGRATLALLISQVAPKGRIQNSRAAAEVIRIAAQEVAIATIGGRGDKSHEDADALRAALAEMLYRYVFGNEPGTA